MPVLFNRVSAAADAFLFCLEKIIYSYFSVHPYQW